MLIFSEYYPDTGVTGIMVIHSSACNSLSCSSLLPPAPPSISATTGADGVEGFACHHHAYMMPARSTGIGRWLGQGLVVAVAMHARGCPSCTHGHRSDAPRAHTVEGGLDSRHETRGWCLWRSTVHDASLTPEHLAGTARLEAYGHGSGHWWQGSCPYLLECPGKGGILYTSALRKKKKKRGPRAHPQSIIFELVFCIFFFFFSGSCS